MATVVYVPGPGFSSLPNARRLGPLFQMANLASMFWNQPPVPLFNAAVDSLSATVASALNPITVVGHSAGAHYVLALLDRGEPEIDHAILCGPALDLQTALLRVAGVAIEDFSNTSPGKAQRLRSLLAESHEFFDGPFEQALRLAAEDPLLFSHYWQDKEAMEWFFKVVTEPAANIRPDDHFATIRELARDWTWLVRPSRPYTVPVTLVFGANDPVIDANTECDVARRIFSRVDFTTFGGSGHWMDLERPEQFVQLVLERTT